MRWFILVSVSHTVHSVFLCPYVCLWESVHIFVWVFWLFCTSTHIWTCVGVWMCWVSTIHSYRGACAHTHMHAHTHREQRIQLRSAAHPRLSNILSAQPKNHNWTLWEALIQSTVTMLSETKSTACSQHINSQLTLSLYLSISASLLASSIALTLPTLSLLPCLFLSSLPLSLSPSDVWLNF